jgi:hypothetical protein
MNSFGELLSQALSLPPLVFGRLSVSFFLWSAFCFYVKCAFLLVLSQNRHLSPLIQVWLGTGLTGYSIQWGDEGEHMVFHACSLLYGQQMIASCSDATRSWLRSIKCGEEGRPVQSYNNFAIADTSRHSSSVFRPNVGCLVLSKLHAVAYCASPLTAAMIITVAALRIVLAHGRKPT